jgi:hypothetical protein
MILLRGLLQVTLPGLPRQILCHFVSDLKEHKKYHLFLLKKETLK